MEKTKEQLLKETICRFKYLVNYNFQPKGFGFTETPDNSEEVKEKIVIKEDFSISYERIGDNTVRVASGKDKKEAIQVAMKRENGKVDQSTIKDYNPAIKEQDQTAQAQPAGQERDYKKDVINFINKLDTGALVQYVKRINTPVEQAEIIGAFAEKIGIPKAKLPVIVQQLRKTAQAPSQSITEAVRPGQPSPYNAKSLDEVMAILYDFVIRNPNLKSEIVNRIEIGLRSIEKEISSINELFGFGKKKELTKGSRVSSGSQGLRIYGTVTDSRDKKVKVKWTNADKDRKEDLEEIQRKQKEYGSEWTDTSTLTEV